MEEAILHIKHNYPSPRLLTMKKTKLSPKYAGRILPALAIVIYSTCLFSQNVEVKDSDNNILLRVEDEDYFGSLFLSAGEPPTIPDNKLYNISGTLWWNNYELSKKIWTKYGTDIYYNLGGVGIGVLGPIADLGVTGINGVLFTGTYDSGQIPGEGAGTRLLWYPKKSAFRVGTVEGTQWDDVNIGAYSVAMGLNAKASDFLSTAIGAGTLASGPSSLALGESTTASGHLATAMGYSTTASGDYSLSTGFGIGVSGDYSVGIALSNQTGTDVANSNTMAIMGGKVGIGTIIPTADLQVSGTNGALFTGTFNTGTIPVEGLGTRMMWYTAKAAFRAGYVNGSQWNDENIGNYSAAMGLNTIASGDGSFATGKNTTASGLASNAFGHYATASGEYSFAMGDHIEASGQYSVAIALNNQLFANVSQDNTMAIMGGRVGIGILDPYRKFEVVDNIDSYVTMVKNSNSAAGDGLRVVLQAVNPGSGNRFVEFLRDGGTAYAGWICGNGAGQVIYSTTSDRRLKMNIKDYENALGLLSEISVKQYEMKSAPGIEMIGLIAQDLKGIYPQAVSGEENGNVEEEPMGIDYGQMTPLLIKAVQEQQEMIRELNEKIDLLNKEISDLKKHQN